MVEDCKAAAWKLMETPVVENGCGAVTLRRDETLGVEKLLGLAKGERLGVIVCEVSVAGVPIGGTKLFAW